MATDQETEASTGRRTVTVPDSAAHGNSSSDGSGGLARITVQRRVEWADTDAAGHHHFSAPLRWVEQAESLLYDRLGIVDLIAASVPRVHFEIDYLARLKYRDLYELTLVVERLGRSSLTYRFEIKDSGGIMAAHGSLVVVLTRRSDRKACPWPQQIRCILAHAGDQSQ